jgi:serine/threonine protein kinase
MIAVKRLKQSALTRKGKKDFAREVEVMAGLRHGSLLRLLAYCNQGKERILVYEYMQNKSLNIYIFGTRSSIIHKFFKSTENCPVRNSRFEWDLNTTDKHALVADQIFDKHISDADRNN